MPEVPVQDKVLVSSTFNSDTHGQLGCTYCHAGDPTGTTRAVAHVGLVSDPSATPSQACSCHTTQVQSSPTMLHTTLRGIAMSLVDRSGGGDTLNASMQTVFGNHCARCHASCGNCHVSVPAAAGGGLLMSHGFRRKPSTTLVCTACHGSRVGDEFRGQNAGIAPDVHYSKGLACVACHSGAEMHAASPTVRSRYDVPERARCTNCHPDDTAFKDATAQHIMHRNTDGTMKLTCHVCHAATYKNCSSCHVSKDADGLAVYTVNQPPDYASVMSFKIGKNPKQGAERPQKFATLRHAPADPANYDYYGAGLSSTFDARPTWEYATPHTIQRRTPQNQSCTACHAHRELFLGPADLAAYEVGANQAVVVGDNEIPQ